MAFRSVGWFSIGLLLASAWGLQYLSLTPDNRILMDPEDPRVVDLSSFEDRFRAQNIIGIVASCSTSDFACISRLPVTITHIHAQAETLPYVERVESLANHPVLRSNENSILNVDFFEEYCNGGCPTGLFERSHPESVFRLANQSGTTMAVFSTLSFDTSETAAVFQINERLEQIEKEVLNSSAVSIHFVGRIPLMHAFVTASIDEVFGYMGLAIVLIGLLLVMAFGNSLLALTSLGLSTATIVTTLGLAGWSGLVLSTGSAAISTIILTLSTATAMHYFMHVVRVMSEDQSRDQKKAALGAISYQLQPILLTAGTTFIAMMSMLLVESPPFRDLGLWTAISMPICVLYLFAIVPSVVAKIPKMKPSKWHLLLQPILNNHARAAGKRKTSAYFALLIATAAAGFIVQLNFDDDFVRYFSPDSRFRADTDHVSANLLGPTNVEIEIRTDESIYDPQFLLAVDRFATALRSHAEIQSVYSVIDVLDAVAPHLIEEDWRSVNDHDTNAQLVFSYELSLEANQSPTDIISFSETSIRISVVAADMSSSGIVELESDIQELAKLYSLSALVTGEAIPIAYLSEKNIPNIALSLLISLLATSLALGLYFRSARLGAILLTTTVVPILCGFGIWTMFQSSIGIAATIILCISTGVVIDDSIHMIYRFNYAYKKLKLDLQEAISYTIHRVGNAVCTTTLILAVGFGVLAFSGFKVNSAFGIVTVLILVCAMLIDLLILPTLLTMMPRSIGENLELTSKNNNSSGDGL